MKKKVTDNSMTFNEFKESILKVDSNLSNLQLKSLFDSLKNKDGKIDISKLMINLTGCKTDT
jgi:hypothetical protein